MLQVIPAILNFCARSNRPNLSECLGAKCKELKYHLAFELILVGIVTYVEFVVVVCCLLDLISFL